MGKQSGFTLIEMLLVLGIMTILSGIAVLNVRKFNNASANAANEIASLVKRGRAYAMTSTTTIKIAPISSTAIQATSASTCAATTRTTINELGLSLPSGANLLASDWSICFTSRGLSQESLNIGINDRSITRTVQVVLGGGIRVI